MLNIRIQLAPDYHTYCPEEGRPYCLNYMNSDGELASTRLTYTGGGLNDRGFYQQITGRRSSSNVHEFDAAGRMIRKFRQYNDGETSTELFHYDKDGRLVEESFESSAGRMGTARYVYDEAGRAAGMRCDGYKGWLHGDIRFEFDAHGKRLAGQILKDGQPAGRIDYQYDHRGNLVHEHWEIGPWSQTLRYTYEDACA